jgi:DNA mismatch repair protein MutS
LNLGTATPRDLLALNRALGQTPKINSALGDVSSLLLQVLAENIFELPEIRDLVDRAIADDAPAAMNEGGIVRTGFNPELDELRLVSTSGKQTIASFEDRQRERTGIPTLKVRFNSVFGYYIEVSKANVGKVPEDYERRQTLANAERYTTPELKDWERKVLGAEERIVQMENDMFLQIRETVRQETQKLQSTARALATLDALASLADVAVNKASRKPMLFPSLDATGRASRHAPVNMIKAKLDTMILVGDIVFSRFFLWCELLIDKSFFV